MEVLLSDLIIACQKAILCNRDGDLDNLKLVASYLVAFGPSIVCIDAVAQVVSSKLRIVL
jgi:hypothetical protein